MEVNKINRTTAKQIDALHDYDTEKGTVEKRLVSGGIVIDNKVTSKDRPLYIKSNTDVSEWAYNAEKNELTIKKAGVHCLHTGSPTTGVSEEVELISGDGTISIIVNQTNEDGTGPGIIDFRLTNPLASKWNKFKWNDPKSRWEPRKTNEGMWDTLLEGITPADFKEALDDLIDQRVEAKVNEILKKLNLTNKVEEN